MPTAFDLPSLAALLAFAFNAIRVADGGALGVLFEKFEAQGTIALRRLQRRRLSTSGLVKGVVKHDHDACPLLDPVGTVKFAEFGKLAGDRFARGPDPAQNCPGDPHIQFGQNWLETASHRRSDPVLAI